VTPEVGPWEKGQTQRYRRRVEREQVVLEPEPGFVHVPQLARCPELAQKVPEKILKEFTWAVFVGIRERRFVRVPVLARCPELIHKDPEHVPEKLRRPMSVGVRERRFVRVPVYTQRNKLPVATL